MLFQWLPGSLIWSLEPSEDLDCKDVTRAVSLVEWTVISAWLFERLRRFGWSSTIPIYLFCWGWFVFPSNSNPPKKSRATVCYGDCIAAFYRNFNHHPRIRLPPGGLKIPGWLPAGDSPGGRKLFGTAPGSIAEKGGRWSCGSFEVNFTGGEAPDSWICL